MSRAVLLCCLVLAGCHRLLPFGPDDARSGEPRPPTELGPADLRRGERADALLDLPRDGRHRDQAGPLDGPHADRGTPGDGPLADKKGIDKASADKASVDKAKPPDTLLLDTSGPGLDTGLVKVELDVNIGDSGAGPFSMTIVPKSCPPASCLLVVAVAQLGGSVSSVTCGAQTLTRVAESNYSGTSSSIWVLKPLTGSCLVTVQSATTQGVVASSSWRNVNLSTIPATPVYLPGQAGSINVAQATTLKGGAMVDAAAVTMGVGLKPSSNATIKLNAHNTAGFSGAVGYTLADATGNLNLEWGLAAMASTDWSHAYLLLSPTPP